MFLQCLKNDTRLDFGFAYWASHTIGAPEALNSSSALMSEFQQTYAGMLFQFTLGNGVFVIDAKVATLFITTYRSCFSGRRNSFGSGGFGVGLAAPASVSVSLRNPPSYGCHGEFSLILIAPMLV